MAPVTPVEALPLPDIPYRLQQLMARNRSNLEKAKIWNFLLWIRDVKKVVDEKKVTQFAHTYHLKTKMAKVGRATVDFSTTTIGHTFQLPMTGLTLATLPALSKTEADEIFECTIKWVKDSKWNLSGARHQWKGWFELVNSYLLFRPEDNRMDHKYVVAAIRTWEGVIVNWSLLDQQRIHEEIQTRKVHHPAVIHLYSKIAELEGQLSERKDKFEQVQEKNAEYLWQVNQLLQDKLSDHHHCEQLKIQNVALKLQLEELRQDNNRLEIEVKNKERVKPSTMERSSNTLTTELKLKVSDELIELSLPPTSLTLETCRKL